MTTRKRALHEPPTWPKSGTIFSDKLKDGSDGPEMVVVPARTFQIGDIHAGGEKTDFPVRTIEIQKPLAIGRYEVIFGEYDQFAEGTGRELPRDEGWGRGDLPVIDVCWYDAIEYAKWLSQQTAKPYRLPTEAEWEYAARAGTETAYWWGNDMKFGIANCDDGSSKWSGKQTSPVGSFRPNPFGLYDTAGNVWEWVADCWHRDYSGAPTDGSGWGQENDGDCDLRVLRGGSWAHKPEYLRSFHRSKVGNGDRLTTVGFRIVRELD